MYIIKAKDYDFTTLTIDRLATHYPTKLYASNELVEVPVYATAYGYVLSGRVWVDGVEVPAGYAFAAKQHIDGKRKFGSKFVAVMRYGFVGLSAMVKVESVGRVQYIDGCTDSVLVAPPRFGDPCLNSLHFPRNITQTSHTHPSIRAGVISSGHGWAVTQAGSYKLETGDAWVIDANEVHHFVTGKESGMTVIAYHPDSNWGPTDEVHPMKNRTYIK